MQMDSTSPWLARFRGVAASALVVAAGIAASQAGAQTINVGVVTATGAGAAPVAEALGVGAQYGFDEFNKKSTKAKLKRVDVNIGANEPATAMNSYRMAISRDDVLTIVGQGSGVLGAVRPILESSKVVGFSIGGADSLIKDNNYLQQVSPFWGDEINALGAYLCSPRGRPQKMARVGILAVGGAAGDSAIAAITKWKALCGIELVGTQRYSIPTTNFKPQLSALAQSRPDAIYVASLGGPENTAIVVQARQLNIKSVMMGPVSGPDLSLFEIDGGEGYIYSGFPRSGLPAEMDAAYTRLGAVAIMGYYYGAVTGQVVGQLQDAGKPITRENFREALLKQRRFVVGGGALCFEPNGHTRMPMSIWQIRGKKPVELGPVPDEACRG